MEWKEGHESAQGNAELLLTIGSLESVGRLRFVEIKSHGTRGVEVSVSNRSRRVNMPALAILIAFAGCACHRSAQQEANLMKDNLKVASLRVLKSGSSCDAWSDRCLEFEAEVVGRLQVPADAEVAFDTDKQEFERRLLGAGIALPSGESTLFRWDLKASSGVCQRECSAYLLVPAATANVYIGLYTF